MEMEEERENESISKIKYQFYKILKVLLMMENEKNTHLSH